VLIGIKEQEYLSINLFTGKLALTWPISEDPILRSLQIASSKQPV